ncbi:MAG: response regulator [Planctomycetota bacterium]
MSMTLVSDAPFMSFLADTVLGTDFSFKPPVPVVMVVEDDDDVRKSLQWQLSSLGFETSVFRTPQQLIELAEFPPFGCLIVDYRLPGQDGIQLLETLRQKECDLPFLFISGHGTVDTAVAAMRLGAIDFLEKPLDTQRLLDTVRRCIDADRNRYETKKKIEVVSKRMETLTRRESQVLDRIVDGLMNKGIANNLDVSVKTVETHRSSLMRKIGVQTSAQLVRLTVEWRAAVASNDHASGLSRMACRP